MTNFHAFIRVVSLKLVRAAFHLCASRDFHAFIRVVSLKRTGCSFLSFKTGNFHAFIRVVSLKHRIPWSANIELSRFPRVHSRGLIEALTVLIWASALSRDFHAFIRVVSLKPNNIPGLVQGLGNFHAFIRVVSLKQEAGDGDAGVFVDFHAFIRVVSLKQLLEGIFVRLFLGFPRVHSRGLIEAFTHYSCATRHAYFHAFIRVVSLKRTDDGVGALANK